MRTRSARLAVCACLLAAGAGIAAPPPERIGYQGVLRSAAGAPLDGTYDMIFRFTDAPAGGTLLLTDYHTGPNAIVVEGGLFTALLGDGTLAPGTETSLEELFAEHSPVWVEVQVGAETLSPRVEVVSTAYALNAGRFGGQLPEGYLDTGPAAQVKQGSLASNTGILAQPGATSGDVRAVQGITVSTGGVGVLGSAFAESGMTEGVRGQSTSPDGRGVVGGAFAASGATVGVYGESQSSDGTGVQGRATAATGGSVGVWGEVASTLGTAVAGVASATSGEAWGVYGETASPEGYGVVSVGDSITAGDVYATGTKYFLAEDPRATDRGIRFACLEGGEVGVYQRGSGRLEAGTAHVELPDPFPLMASGRITVQVTAQEDCGGLYVPPEGISAAGFTVRESGGARSNAAFTYLVMAERSGYEDAEPEASISVTEKILASRSFTPSQKARLRSALAARPVGPDERAELYSTLDEGDYDGSCRLLGGCRPAASAVTPRQDEPPPRRPTAAAVAGGAAPAPERFVARPSAAAAGPAPEEPASPSARPAPAAPPSTLVTLEVVSETVRPGDVVALDPLNPGAVRPASETADPGVIGVVAPSDGLAGAGGKAPVAVAGIAACHVDADYGWIAAGDLLVTSPTRGHAMRAEDPAPGTVLGKALEPLEAGQGTIRVLIAPR